MASESDKSAQSFYMIFTIQGKLLCLMTLQLWGVHFPGFTNMRAQLLGSVDGSIISYSSHRKKLMWLFSNVVGDRGWF